jgi:magnesium transporter
MHHTRQRRAGTCRAIRESSMSENDARVKKHPATVKRLARDVSETGMNFETAAAGIAIGAALAVIAAPLVWSRCADQKLALTVGVSVFAAASTSTVVAMLLPWCLTFMKLDPAFGSGPLATVIQDVLSIWIYLLVAYAFFTP